MMAASNLPLLSIFNRASSQVLLLQSYCLSSMPTPSIPDLFRIISRILKKRLSSSSSSARPIHYAFDPVDAPLGPPPIHEGFSFLSPSEWDKSASSKNALLLHPQNSRVPWETSFPACLECRHWPAAEDAARELMDMVCRADLSSQGTVPETLKNGAKENKMNELIDTSVACAIHLYPTASAPKIRILTKALIFLFLHDDIVEYTSSKDDTTLIDQALTDQTENLEKFDEMRLKHNLFWNFSKEVLETDPVRGRKLIEAILGYADFSRNHAPTSNTRFERFSDYLAFRNGDIANGFMIAALQFSCDFEPMDEEVKLFETLTEIYIRHSFLINDLYSYEKERLEMKVQGATLINAVKALQDTLSVSASTGKAVLRSLIWDLERQMHDIYSGLLKDHSLNNRQLQYARRIIETTAGNIYYSATVGRYAKPAVEANNGIGEMMEKF